ncbi:conserved Plasmodium protein, unknown function [Plasmodium knowlesi strain H]|uniref:Uncharacterized protein n=3 Tax=Plasmodium knowlesi TaxID=5850 RepID=A0A5E7WZ80_PLAKH|nr:conserved Plasmodium protein, unknown function [Plasmodium knowlesi strain H]OTN64968.1 Uncharacterized protein PKNOH_S120124100 [Plasmodium knowlesi]CAA9988107.1 conserved Plasmodium protein, unknown function [Plasmodium knowlesi strain H]SBO19977.1 conserved Plasmodium protein, unknown function [Plasmodium knowlesi strain H]SBO29110.1 conserved Plasmodium protein, unknown function [Plasmodium knowlesi strain H]VVS77581.1 conserved Plasmodium protein, unknown function [Plasmodium knowlesi 
MAQRLRQGAPLYPNEQSAASSPEDTATSPSRQLNQSTAKKDTHTKKRDQAFKNFIYQNIFNKDRFTNIFKKKITQYIGRECNHQDNTSNRNEEHASVYKQLPYEDEEYMLFLSYIYNDVTSFIEINKNEHLKNSNYADLEDFILEICGTVCRDTFHNIKSIFKSPGGGSPRKESVCKHADDALDGDINQPGGHVKEHACYVKGYASDPYKHHSCGDKGKGVPLQSNSPSENDSSFFFIPPMECLVTHIHKLASKKDDANSVCHFSSDINEFLKNNKFDKHPIYRSLQRGDKPRKKEDLSFECELSQERTGRVKQPLCDCSGCNGSCNGERSSCSSVDNIDRNHLHSQVDTSSPDIPPTHSHEERLLLQDETEKITPNEKKHDEEGVQYIHAHSRPSEHIQIGTNFEVSSNKGTATIYLDIKNFNENEVISSHRESPHELACSLVNGTTPSNGGDGNSSSFSRPNYGENSNTNDERTNEATQGNLLHDLSKDDDCNEHNVCSVKGKTLGHPFWRQEEFMNGSSQAVEEAHRGIHHYSQSNPDDDLFGNGLGDYFKPTRAPNDNQDMDTNDDDSKDDADSEEHDVAEKMDGVVSEVGDLNGEKTPNQDDHPDEQTSNNIKRQEDIHLSIRHNSDQLEDDNEGIITRKENDSPKEHPLKKEPLKMEQLNETPQRIIQVDQKEYLEKQQKMVKNKSYADPENRGEFKKNENPHDDYYHFKYLNNCEKVPNPYQYTKVEKKANIQVTPSPFPQFLRDIQIYNISQKKIRLKKTNIALRRDDADVGIPEKTTNKKKRQSRKSTK